nr:EamA family transporter [Micromonospora sp. DSM 115978]
GLLVGALSLGLVGGLGVAPFEFSADRVALEGIGVVPWVVPMAVVVVVSTAFAYFTGLLAAGTLGSRVASFVGLFEVLFAVVLAWLLLADVPTYVQAFGGAFVVAGVVLVKLERDRAGSGTVDAPGVDSLPVTLPAGISPPRDRAGGAPDDQVRREHQLLDGR